MGNIGDDFDETIPAVGTAGTGYATTVNAFLTEVQARLEAQIPFSSLLIDTLDMSNNPITGAQYVSLYPGTGVPTTPTYSIQEYGGNLYWISPTGAVKITDGSSINASGVGGITGDYGGVDPSQFRFVGADATYYAYDDYAGASWARVWARSFDVAGDATGTERIRITWAGSGSSYTLTLPAAVPANTVLVQMDSSGSLSASNSLATDQSITLSGTGLLKHGTRRLMMDMMPTGVTTGSVAMGTDGGGAFGAIGASGSVFYVSIRALSNNDRIGDIVFANNNTGAASHTYALVRVNSSGIISSLASTASALNSVTLTVNSTLIPSYAYYILVTMGAGACTFIYADVSWSRV